jgi:hypothetical protein
MTPFEEELKKALARRQPPDGFTARVLAKAENKRARTSKWNPRIWFHHAQIWRLVPALVVLLAVTAGAVFQRHQRAVRGEEAKEKLLTAMRIAGTKLHDTQQHVIDLQGTEVK